MTIEDLIKQLQTDRQFAKEFRTLAGRCCRDRDNLKAKGVTNPTAAKRFLKSWGEFYGKFAFDPTSLAALMAPENTDYKACGTETGQLTPLTETQVVRLYDSGRSKRGTTAAKSPSTAAKKSTRIK